MKASFNDRMMHITYREIVDYWSCRVDEWRISVDWSEADKRCWRCTQRRRLQRCHIVPRSLKGSDTPGNLILLCAQCHAEAPNVDDPDFMWLWLMAHAEQEYGTYWVGRGIREFEFLFRRKPFCDIDPENVEPLLQAALSKYTRRAVTHWGQGQHNAATVAWILFRCEEEAKKAL